MRDSSFMGNMKNTDSKINSGAKRIMNMLKTTKKQLALDSTINLFNNYVNSEIKNLKDNFNPIDIAKNLHMGNYAESATENQLFAMNRIYKQVNYKLGLIEVGYQFLSKNNYHGAIQSFVPAKHVQGLLDVTKAIIKEVQENKNSNNIGYAKTALESIVKFEGKNKVVKEYINIIADAFMGEYKSLDAPQSERAMIMNSKKEYLDSAIELYKLNGNILGRIKAYNIKRQHKSPYQINPSSNYVKSGIM